MIIRSPPAARSLHFIRLYTVLCVVLFASAELLPFDCHPTVNSVKYDLTPLGGPHSISRERNQPPTTWIDTVTFDLCDKLKKQDNIPEGDQCPDGTQVCFTKTNKKSGEKDRITSVISIAQESSLSPDLSNLQAPQKGLIVKLHGPEYPHPSNSTPTVQVFKLTLFCEPDHAEDPKFISYDGTELQVEWKASAGCPLQEDGNKGGHDGGDSKPGEGGKPQDVGSGIGWFFLVIFLAFLAYIGLGAYYNYSTYGASGYDLIPHRDFWREVPYMLSDVLSHLCSTVRPRRTASRGGYISV